MRHRKESKRPHSGRRCVLKAAVAGATSLAMPPALWAVPAGEAETGRELAFYGLHTGESLRTSYWEEGRYLPWALKAINSLLRDHRTGEIRAIEPALLDLLWAIQQRVGGGDAFHVISGYRSASTNAALRAASGGVAKQSLHMEGRAIDVRLPGIPTGRLRKAAIALRRGGVGYYPRSDFLHVDTGPIRYW